MEHGGATGRGGTARDDATAAADGRESASGPGHAAFAACGGISGGTQHRPSACPHCRGRRLWRWGCSGRGRQRWLCRDCRRTCSSITGTAIAGVHVPAKLDAVIVDMAEPRPQACRALAEALELDKSTVWRWRRTICQRLAEQERPPDGPFVDHCRAIFRESRKASRQWVRHASDPSRFPPPDRRRWIDYRRLKLPLPCPMTPYRIVVDCALTGHASHHLTVLGTEQALAEQSTPVCRPPAEPPGGRAGCRVQASVVAAELGAFIRPFRGPATRYLPGYVAWLATRLGRNRKERCLAIAACLLGHPA